MSRYFCDGCDATYPNYALGTHDLCPECFGPVTAVEPRTIASAFDGQPAFMPSFAAPVRYGQHVAVEVKAGSGVYKLEPETVE